MKDEIDSSTVIAQDLNTPLSTIDYSSNKLSKKGDDINKTIHQITEESIFSSLHKPFCKICKILDHCHEWTISETD